MMSLTVRTNERRQAVFWIFMLIGCGAVAFMKLGMYLVLIKVLMIALAAAGLIISGLILLMLWRRVFPKP